MRRHCRNAPPAVPPARSPAAPAEQQQDCSSSRSTPGTQWLQPPCLQRHGCVGALGRAGAQAHTQRRARLSTLARVHDAMGNARTPCANARTHPRALARTQARTHARTRPPACAHTGDQSKAQQNQDIPSGPVDKQGAVWPGWVIDILFLLNVAGISYAGGRQGGKGGGGSSRLLLVHRRGHARHPHAKLSVLLPVTSSSFGN